MLQCALKELEKRSLSLGELEMHHNKKDDHYTTTS